MRVFVGVVDWLHAGHPGWVVLFDAASGRLAAMPAHLRCGYWVTADDAGILDQRMDLAEAFLRDLIDKQTPKYPGRREMRLCAVGVSGRTGCGALHLLAGVRRVLRALVGRGV